MKMGERIYKGYWWKPDSPDEQIAGTLTVDDRGNIKLELLGYFEGEEKVGFYLESKDQKVIFGRCYAPNGHMKDVSLTHCRSSFSYNFSSKFPLTRYTCSFALIGVHVRSLKDAEFFKAQVEFQELAYWCPPTNILASYSEEAITVKINIADNEERTKARIKLEDGTQLLLRDVSTYTPDYPKLNISQDTYLEIQKENISVGDVFRVVRCLERLLSVAVLYPVERSAITLYSRRVCQDMENGEKFYHPIELVSFFYKDKIEQGKKNPDYLFRYEDIADGFGEMFNRLYTDENIAQILSNLIASLEKKRVFTSNDFLIVAQAVDGFAIRFRKEGDFKEQLKSLRDEFSSIKKMKLTNEDIEAVKGSRHFYSHILKMEKKEVKGAVEGVDLLNLTERLRVLLLCCVLNFLRLSNEKIDELMNKCNNNLLRR